MGFNRFRIAMITRIVFLLLSGLALLLLFQHPSLLFTTVMTMVLMIYQVVDLIRYVERTNRKLVTFLESINYNDFSITFSDNKIGPSFIELNKAFNQVMTEFRRSRAEKEEHFNYLQTIVQHISIGIVVFVDSGKVVLTNEALFRLLGISSLRTIKELNQVSRELPEALQTLKGGEKTLVKLFLEDQVLQLSVFATEFKMQNERYVLASVQDISIELDEKEIESWQKLIRVLTHEIMNSITPISSLAQTVKEMMLEEGQEIKVLRNLEHDDLDNIADALDTIQRRSQGLLNFVELYRNLTRIPRPNFRYVHIKELFLRVRQLMMPRLDGAGINFRIMINPEQLMVTADPDLIEQVLINLLLNACDAVKEVATPHIKLEAFTTGNGRVAIEIRDNGTGITPDLLDKIFMPFFTSKREGSGIGLSLSRQIMHLHKGTISVKSAPGQGATFMLVF